jgi:hypothetical protein
MQTNATNAVNGDVSSDELKECLLCNHLTEQNPRTLHVRQDGGANHGQIEAKAYICRDCLTETDGWEYNQVQRRNDDSDPERIMTDGGRTIEDYVDLGEAYDDRFDRPDGDTVDRSDPSHYTFHTEPEYLGGEQYARCKHCGTEAVQSHEQVLHDEDCKLWRDRQ